MVELEVGDEAEVRVGIVSREEEEREERESGSVSHSAALESGAVVRGESERMYRHRSVSARPAIYTPNRKKEQ